MPRTNSPSNFSPLDPRVQIQVMSLAAVVVGAVAIGAVVATSQAARHPAVTTNPAIYISPAEGTFAPGSTLTFEIRENSLNTPVNAIVADLAYPADKLELASIDTTTSAFGVAAQSTNGPGTTKLVRGTTTPLTGDQPVATINFTVLPTGGSAALSFLPDSGIVSSVTNANLPGTTTAVVSYYIH